MLDTLSDCKRHTEIAHEMYRPSRPKAWCNQNQQKERQRTGAHRAVQLGAHFKKEPYNSAEFQHGQMARTGDRRGFAP